MRTVTWLHLSDLHLGEEGASQRYNRDVVLRKLLEDIRNRTTLVHASLSHLDFVAITGDLAHGGRASEYALVTETFLSPVAQAAGVGQNGLGRVFVVPGNHDVDRAVVRNEDRQAAEQLTSRELINEALLEDAPRSAFFRRQEAYFRFFAEQFPALPIQQPGGFYVSQFSTETGVPVAIVGLNSSWLAFGGDGDERRLAVGEVQLDRAIQLSEAAELTVALMHHPLDWLLKQDSVIIEGLLQRHCDFLLRGHEHVPQVRGIQTLFGGVIEIPCGAAYDRREFANGYNYVQVDLDSGLATVYLRRWNDGRREWQSDTTSTGDASEGRATLQLPTGRGTRLQRDGARTISAGAPAAIDWTRYARDLQADVAAEHDWYEPLSVSVPKQSAVPVAEFGPVLVGLAGSRTAAYQPLDLVALQHKRMVVAGPPGAGKTTGLHQLVGTMATSGFTPLLVPLADLDSEGMLPLIRRVLWRRDVRLRVGAETEVLRDGSFCLLLDGFNEIPAPLRPAATSQLRAMMRDLPDTRFVVSTRSHEIPAVDQVPVFEIQPLSTQQMQSLAVRYLGEDRGRDFSRRLRASPRQLSELAGTPLFLKMLLEVFESTGAFPLIEGDLFRRFFDHVFDQRERERGSIYSGLEKTAILGRLAFTMIGDGELWLPQVELTHRLDTILRGLLDLTSYYPTRAKLQDRWVGDELAENGILVTRDGRAGFAHQALAEYFAARYLEEAFVSQGELPCDPSTAAFQQSLRYLAGLLQADAARLDLLLDRLLPASLRLFAYALTLSLPTTPRPIPTDLPSELYRWAASVVQAYAADSSVLRSRWALPLPVITDAQVRVGQSGKEALVELIGPADSDGDERSREALVCGVGLSSDVLLVWTPRAVAADLAVSLGAEALADAKDGDYKELRDLPVALRWHTASVPRGE